MIGDIIIFAALYIVLRVLLKSTNTDRTNGESVLTKLKEKVTTEKNSDRVDQLFTHHKNRVNAGAVEQESLVRLLKELRDLNRTE